MLNRHHWMTLVAALGALLLTACSIGQEQERRFALNLNQTHSQVWWIKATGECATRPGEPELFMKRRQDAEWRPFSRNIEGFDCQQNRIYRIRVAVSPATDSREERYTLLDILETQTLEEQP
ncbi:MAG: DUF4377 domain-containing protein [Pseudomonadota bacterium]